MESAQTEEERVKAMFSLNQAQWQQKQEEMAHETRVPMTGSKPYQKKSNVPEGEPPHGYICYRCGKKGMLLFPLSLMCCVNQRLGHWIQACPTNDDVNYDNKNRIKRTTGIPRSMLKVIDQADIDKLDENERQHLMVNAEGQYVFAQADEKEWRRHLERVKATEAAKKQVQIGNKELQDRGLECTIDKQLFVDPMKTPCCGKTYCHDCIENALIENDLTCPGCQTENVTLERLEPDEDMKARIKAYEMEKSEARKRSKSPSGSPKSPEADVPAAGSPAQSQAGTKSPALSDVTLRSKKRSADEAAEDKLKNPTVPAMKRQKSSEPTADSSTTDTDAKSITPADSAANLPFNMMPPDMSTMMQNMQQMNFPMPMPMPMPGMPFIPMPGLMNPVMMQNFMPPNFDMSMMNGMNGMNGMNLNAMNMNGMNMNGMNMNGMFPQANFGNPMINDNGFNGNQQHHNMFNNPNQNQNPQQKQKFQHNNSPMTGMAGVPTGPKNQRINQNQNVNANYPPSGPANNKFSNQQRHVGKEEDNAYIRQPVNPHRHQNRGKRGIRQADYREL
jgi:protein MPE1